MREVNPRFNIYGRRGVRGTTEILGCGSIKIYCFSGTTICVNIIAVEDQAKCDSAVAMFFSTSFTTLRTCNGARVRIIHMLLA